MSEKNKLDETSEEVVQQIDLTELVNYVNYLGEKIGEIEQTSSVPNTRFGIEVVESEGELSGIKYFHSVCVDNLCSGVSKHLKEFYLKKYGTVPEVAPIDFYTF